MTMYVQYLINPELDNEDEGPDPGEMYEKEIAMSVRALLIADELYSYERLLEHVQKLVKLPQEYDQYDCLLAAGVYLSILNHMVNGDDVWLSFYD